MKKLVLPMIFVIVTLFLVGSAFAATTSDKAVVHVKAGQLQSSTSTFLMDSGSNKFYWGERGGVFSYNWKTYKTSKNNVVVIVHYKTFNNSWYGSYNIIKSLNNRLRIVNTSPEVKLYSGHLSDVSYISTSLSPTMFYWNRVRGQIKTSGYYT